MDKREQDDLAWGAKELQSHLYAHRIHASLLRDLGDTPTVEAAAQALEVEPRQVIKTLLFWIERPGEGQEPLVVISHGKRRVSRKLLAAHFGVGRKRVRLSSPEKVVALLGFPVGGVPPLGHRETVTTYLDASIVALQDEGITEIYGGGGDDKTMMHISIQELLRVLKPHIMTLSDPPPEKTDAADSGGAS